MRFPRPFSLVVSAFVALTFLPAVATAVPTPAAPARTADPLRSERAEATLAAVEAAFARGPARERAAAADGREVTLLLARLRLQLDELGVEDRRVARTYLARPTGGGDPYVRYPRKARPTNDCKVARTKGSKVCVHWARATHHAPPKGDRDRDKVPNQVEKVRDITNAVWNRVVTRGGYRRPPADQGGPNGKLDIYLANIGASGLYGYCVTEDWVSGRAYTGYCVLDDDYSRSEFPANTPTENLKVTVAHEFFHAVQFGYDAGESAWFMEGSAAWIEDELYDAVDDNHIYLRTSPLARPELPLDRSAGLHVYGSWIFWRFLTERYADEGGTGLPLAMRRLWEDADHLDGTKPRLQAVAALRSELSDQSATLSESLADFAVAARRPTGAFEEGAAYERYVADPTAQPAPLNQAFPGVSGTLRVDHLAGATVRLRPAADLGARRTLDLTADRAGLGADAAVRVHVVGTDGSVRREAVVPTGGGWRATVTGFDTATTRHVEVTVVNGTERTDDVVFGYTATATTGSR